MTATGQNDSANQPAVTNDAAEAARRGAAGAAEAVGQSNGRTAIGSSASDVGSGNLAAAADAMKRMGIGSSDQLLPNLPGSDSRGSSDNIAGGDNIGRILEALKPTQEQREQAGKTMEQQISGLLSPEDRQRLSDMQKAVLDGNHQELGKRIAELQNDPAKLKAYIDEMNKNFKQAGADTRMEIGSDGRVIMHNGGNTAVVFGKDGQASVHEIRHRLGGIVLGGEVVGANPQQTATDIGNSTVHQIAPRSHGIILNPGRGGSLPQFPGGNDSSPLQPLVPNNRPHWEHR